MRGGRTQHAVGVDGRTDRPPGRSDGRHCVGLYSRSVFDLIRRSGSGIGGIGARTKGWLDAFFALSFFGRFFSLWPLSFLATVSLLACHH